MTHPLICTTLHIAYLSYNAAFIKLVGRSVRKSHREKRTRNSLRTIKLSYLVLCSIMYFILTYILKFKIGILEENR